MVNLRNERSSNPDKIDLANRYTDVRTQILNQSSLVALSIESPFAIANTIVCSVNAQGFAVVD